LQVECFNLCGRGGYWRDSGGIIRCRQGCDVDAKRHGSIFRVVQGVWLLASTCNCDVVVCLQGQLRAMRHELTTSNAYSAAAVAEAGGARAAAAAAAAASGAAARVASPTMAASPGLAVMRCCSPAAAAAAAAATMGAGDTGAPACCCSSDAPGTAAAAAVVAAELQALRASRANYQSAVLQQQAVRNNLLGSLGEVLQVGATRVWVWVGASVSAVWTVLPQSLRMVYASHTVGLPRLLARALVAASCITSGSSCSGKPL
jgi:hypothetical protein